MNTLGKRFGITYRYVLRDEDFVLVSEDQATVLRPRAPRSASRSLLMR